jgi:hypothetical protein
MREWPILRHGGSGTLVRQLGCDLPGRVGRNRLEIAGQLTTQIVRRKSSSKTAPGGLESLTANVNPTGL